MFLVKLADKLPCVELREMLGLEDIAAVFQRNGLRWYDQVRERMTVIIILRSSNNNIT